MKRIFLIAIIILPAHCFAQVHASLSTGLGGFAMNDMKKHQMELKAQFPVGVKVIKSFPSYWFYDLSITGNVSDRVRVGGTIGFMSTGGRMDYRDYSGSIGCDQIATTWTPAFRGDVLINPKSQWPVYYTTRIGAAFGLYELNAYSDINGDEDRNNIKFQSINAFIEPGFIVTHKVAGPLSVTVSAGYNIAVFKGKQKFSTDNSLFLLNNSNEKITLDWSGFRLGIGLSVNLTEFTDQ